MPRKPRHTKGQQPRVNKTSRTEYSNVQKAQATALIEVDGNSCRKAARIADMDQGQLSKIRARAVSRAQENDWELTDTRCYENKPRSGRPKVLTKAQGDEICEWVTATKDRRGMLARQIKEEIGLWLDIQVSEDVIKKLMYERGYVHSKNQWKTHLEDHHKATRLAYCRIYQSVDWTNGVCTDEANIRLHEPRRQARSWKKSGGEEDFGVDTLEHKEGRGFSEGMIYGVLAFGRKSRLVFIYKETEAEENRYQKLLEEENAKNMEKHRAQFRAEKALEDMNLKATNQKRKGRYPGFPGWLNQNNKIKKRGDKRKGGYDWLRH